MPGFAAALIGVIVLVGIGRRPLGYSSEWVMLLLAAGITTQIVFVLLRNRRT